MSAHLSKQSIALHVMGCAPADARRHVIECANCQSKIGALASPLDGFRSAVHHWSERTAAAGRAETLEWEVIPAADHLSRLLLPPTLDVPWYRSLWSAARDAFQPAPAALDITSKPVLVKDIWGQYGRQKKSWVMSLALQSALVMTVLVAATNKTVQQKVRESVTLVMPADINPYQPKPAPTKIAGGGGGGDRSPLPASKGRLPKFALQQFTPPAQVVANPNPKLSMDPSLIGPPDLKVANVDMAQFGDPLARIGPPSNGPGSGGGIGSGKGGGVGSGTGGGLGPGEGGGVGGGAYRVGGGVTAPALLTKVEPEYSEEARKAKFQGTVELYVEVDPQGRAVNMRVIHSLGMGLDEKAIEAVKKWKFKPGTKDGKPVQVQALVAVTFRLL
jgi:TonB family protein